MPILNGRIERLERHFGSAGDDPGRLVLASPNAWPDEDRHLYEVLSIRHDGDGLADLIEKNTGVRPSARPGCVRAIVMPAPLDVEQADEATRRAWCAAHQRRPWMPERERGR